MPTDVERLVRAGHPKECYYCGRTEEDLKKRGRGTTRTLTVDHKRPRSQGGTDDIANKVVACQPCNLSKGVLGAKEYARARQIMGFRLGRAEELLA